MKRFFLFVFILGLTTLNAQIHEIGVFLGGNNFIGDVGKTNYVAPNEFAYGIVYKWNRSPRHAWRFSYTQAKISASDSKSSESARIKRDLSFVNDVKELSVGFEFNFFDFNLHEFGQKITPYLYSGLSYTVYNGLFFAGNQSKYNATHGTIGIPMTVGIKTNISPSWIIGAEVGARYTFKDDLDGSNPTNENLKSLKFGNLNSNDWYVFSGITLTYTFGQKSCYCKE